MSVLRQLFAWCALVALAVAAAPMLSSPEASTLRLQRWQAQLEQQYGAAGAGRIVERAAAANAPPALALAALRGTTLLAWTPMLAPLWLAAWVQGLAIRDARRERFAPANPRLYRAALLAAVALAGAGVLVLVLPVDLPLLAIPTWGALLAAAISAAGAHRPAWRS